MSGEFESDCVAALLECLPVAGAIVDSDGLISVANIAAERTFADRDGLFQSDGRLQFICCTSQKTFLDRLRGTDLENPRSTIMQIPRRLTHTAWLLHIRPLEIDRNETMGLVSWLDPRTPPRLDWQFFPAIFGLSPAEAKVVRGLTQGHDLVSIAGQLGIRQDTARTHLKAAFRKMGVHRQQELIQTATMLSWFS